MVWSALAPRSVSGLIGLIQDIEKSIPEESHHQQSIFILVHDGSHGQCDRQHRTCFAWTIEIYSGWIVHTRPAHRYTHSHSAFSFPSAFLLYFPHNFVDFLIFPSIFFGCSYSHNIDENHLDPLIRGFCCIGCKN